jgi:DNA-binding response OmpR family regulator
VTLPEVKPPQPPLHPGDETVLLVEDEPEVRSLVERILKTQGYTVVTAANPDAALEVAREFKGTIQVMVTDVVMPGMSGLQLAERLMPTRPNMRVLFVSGYTNEAIGHHGVLDPGTAFLQKPFTPNALARKVREVLEGVGPLDLKNP